MPTIGLTPRDQPKGVLVLDVVGLCVDETDTDRVTVSYLSRSQSREWRGVEETTTRIYELITEALAEEAEERQLLRANTNLIERHLGDIVKALKPRGRTTREQCDEQAERRARIAGHEALAHIAKHGINTYSQNRSHG